jgi:hypothetical protein
MSIIKKLIKKEKEKKKAIWERSYRSREYSCSLRRGCGWRKPHDGCSLYMFNAQHKKGHPWNFKRSTGGWHYIYEDLLRSSRGVPFFRWGDSYQDFSSKLTPIHLFSRNWRAILLNLINGTFLLIFATLVQTNNSHDFSCQNGFIIYIPMHLN